MPSRLRAFVIVAGRVPGVGRAPRRHAARLLPLPRPRGRSLVFTAEGDLWKTTVDGGVPERLTAHPGRGNQRGAVARRQVGRLHRHLRRPRGGLRPAARGRRAEAADVGRRPRARSSAWTPDGKVLCTTRRYSTLPNASSLAIDPVNGVQTAVPLAQASDGTYAERRHVCTSRACRFRAATRDATRAAPRSSSGASRRGASEAAPVTARLRRHQQVADALAGTGSTSSATATAR